MCHMKNYNIFCEWDRMISLKKKLTLFLEIPCLCRALFPIASEYTMPTFPCAFFQYLTHRDMITVFFIKTLTQFDSR